MAKKSTPVAKSKKDYLRLPFEVYYSGPISYASLELTAEVDRLKKPKEIKGVHIEEGNAYGLNFYCANNGGGELLCCLTASHDGTVPSWLKFIEVEEVNMNHGYNTGVELTGVELNLNAPESDESEYLETTGVEKGIYRLTSEDVDYIILDADGDRIKIDSYGCLIDEDRDDEDDDSTESPQIIDVEKLAEMEDISEYTTKSYQEAQDEWIAEVWAKYFPKLPKVKITAYAY